MGYVLMTDGNYFLDHFTPSAQKGPKKNPIYIFFAFELGIVFCSPCQGEQNTMLSSKAIKNISGFFSGLFGQRA
jgi:hypothetical protein